MIRDYTDTFADILRNTSITDAEGHLLDDDQAYHSAMNGMKSTRNRNGTVYLTGNGGSSAIVSHVGIDLLNKGHFKSYPITDNSLLTCLANDYGYENVFLKVLEKTATSQDALIAVSSSGKSPSIVNAASWAKSHGLFVITFSGFTEQAPLRSCGHINFWLNSKNYGKVETGHALLLHILTDQLWVE